MGPNGRQWQYSLTTTHQQLLTTLLSQMHRYSTSQAWFGGAGPTGKSLGFAFRSVMYTLQPAPTLHRLGAWALHHATTHKQTSLQLLLAAVNHAIELSSSACRHNSCSKVCHSHNQSAADLQLLENDQQQASTAGKPTLPTHHNTEHASLFLIA